ncbi:MAG: DUF444 family protein [Candidatus Delongbacteria bacterium]|nr:DUF444 family protein [Candidatus Delongbacteria bacterium]MBN2834825.1 DUF444 family protein [Candidatus Delongbacteria bacterium]
MKQVADRDFIVKNEVSTDRKLSGLTNSFTNDVEMFLSKFTPPNPLMAVKTLDELLERDRKREEDGFPRRIRLGKIVKPGKDTNGKVVIVPTTYEPKFYHDNSVTEEDDGGSTGGTGDGEEGQVLGEQQAQPEEGEGEGEGAGEGQGENHDVTSDAFDLGKVLTEKFKLPNLKEKGKKRSSTKYTYDLTDKNRKFGQLLDKKASIKRVIKTNILLGRIEEGKPFDPEKLLISPNDEVYRILSREKDYESQALVFFIRDYSGSMQGKPTESVVTQHLFIYSWLMYQYKNNVQTRFIVHDTEAKEVEDFYKYYRSQVAGGTNVHPAFNLVNKIVYEEQLAKDYNIYVFYGTDGDDWSSDGKETIKELREIFKYASRVGFTIAENSWSSTQGNSTVEKYIKTSGLLKEFKDLFRMDSFKSASVDENRLIEGIKKLLE